MMLLVENGGGVYIIGDRTANTSNDDDYRKLSKMVVRNKVMKDLVAFCNLKTDDRFDDRILRRGITSYLNDCQRKKLFRSYSDLIVRDTSQDEVDISVKLHYFDTKSKYNISINGEDGQWDKKQEKED